MKKVFLFVMVVGMCCSVDAQKNMQSPRGNYTGGSMVYAVKKALPYLAGGIAGACALTQCLQAKDTCSDGQTFSFLTTYALIGFSTAASLGYFAHTTYRAQKVLLAHTAGLCTVLLSQHATSIHCAEVDLLH